jgi:hypothetical protein
MGFLVSVVVRDHDVAGFTSVEVEDNAELVVDADAVPAHPRIDTQLRGQFTMIVGQP